MFGPQEFNSSIDAFNREKEGRASNSFTNLRKKNDFFHEIRSKSDVNRQIETFINIISEMDRESFSNRYVISCFLLDFCKYLERDFLFNIKNKKDFMDMKGLVGNLIEKIVGVNKTFSQNAKLHTLEHLLEYYGVLLDSLEEPEGEVEEGGLWGGNNLW